MGIRPIEALYEITLVVMPGWEMLRMSFGHKSARREPEWVLNDRTVQGAPRGRVDHGFEWREARGGVILDVRVAVV